MKIVFAERAWEDYLYWQKNDKKMLRRINGMIKEIMRTPFTGKGKPEALRENLSGYWSRRTNLEHRLLYKVDDTAVYIVQCRFHY